LVIIIILSSIQVLNEPEEKKLKQH
jgi:hypothetical protein